MKKYQLSDHKNSRKNDFPEQISWVMRAYEKDGYVNRKTLMEMYGLTQIQAGALMRDFIHANAVNLEWHPADAHYKLAVKSEKN